MDTKRILNANNPDDVALFNRDLETSDVYYGFRQVINKRRLEIAEQRAKQAASQ